MTAETFFRRIRVYKINQYVPLILLLLLLCIFSFDKTNKMSVRVKKYVHIQPYRHTGIQHIAR